MKKYFLSLILMSFLQQIHAQTVEQTIETLERQRFEAQVRKDLPVLEKIFADDLVYIHGSGNHSNSLNLNENDDTMGERIGGLGRFTRIFFVSCLDSEYKFKKSV